MEKVPDKGLNAHGLEISLWKRLSDHKIKWENILDLP